MPVRLVNAARARAFVLDAAHVAIRDAGGVLPDALADLFTLTRAPHAAHDGAEVWVLDYAEEEES